MRLGGGGLGDDFTEVRRKNWGEKVCKIMYEIPKELKLEYFFSNNYSTFCIILSVVIFSDFSRGCAEVMSAMYFQMTKVQH